jgi:hypothetical protein
MREILSLRREMEIHFLRDSPGHKQFILEQSLSERNETQTQLVQTKIDQHSHRWFFNAFQS